MGSVVGSESSNQNEVFKTYSRRAHHAGSWYDDDANELRTILNTYLDEAAKQMPSFRQESSSALLRAVVVPHAGYRYSGPTAAYAYAAIQHALADCSSSAIGIDHVIVLHPSHHVYLEGCAVSAAHELQTPFGALPVDDSLRSEILHLSSRFSHMTQKEDEQEHSGEMQYPYLSHIFSSTSRKKNISVLPIMVGALSTSQEEQFGHLLAPILARPNILTVVSSDFCHWGKRFSYRPTPPESSSSTKTPIHEFISQLDHDGMSLIQQQQPGAFAAYLKKTRNTICGRHPISVWLHAITAPSVVSNGRSMEVRFVKYAQSSAVASMHDSSVSYAAALATLETS